nr:unnamed protein product [Digitaria exilis]
MSSLLSSSYAKSCKCSGATDQDLGDRYTTNTTFSKIDGDLFLMKPGTLLPDSLGFYKNHPSKLNLSDPGMFVISDEIELWVHGDNGAVHETSFTVEFSMSMYQPTTVSNYVPLQNQMSIKVIADAEGHQKNPAKFKAILPLNDIDYTSIWPYGLFTLSSSMGQLLELHAWNITVERFRESRGKKESMAIILSTVLGSAAVAAVTAAIVYWYFNSRYRRYKMDLDQLAKSMQLLPGMPTQFNFTDIQKATRNFHETMKLGQGGFGAVYRCRLPPLKMGDMLVEVAVKKFSRDDNRGYECFLAEVSIINRLRHKNVVPLIGWSYNKGEPILIYEYMPNGSLDQLLFHRSARQEHPVHIHRWDTRYNIVKDIATGLHYVHHEHEPIVLHRDIKANNIMIDSTFQARLGDFGLACVVAEGKNSYTDISAPGTLGFRAPEYIYTGKATTKSDIFAFGVLILEIVTGKTAVSMQFSHVSDWVWHLHREDRLLSAIDPMLTTNEFEANDAKRLLLLGLACSSPNPSDRPTMVVALQIITKLAPPPDVPLEKPRFVWPPEEAGRRLSCGHSTNLSILESSLTKEIEMMSIG